MLDPVGSCKAGCAWSGHMWHLPFTCQSFGSWFIWVFMVFLSPSCEMSFQELCKRVQNAQKCTESETLNELSRAAGPVSLNFKTPALAFSWQSKCCSMLQTTTFFWSSNLAASNDDVTCCLPQFCREFLLLRICNPSWKGKSDAWEKTPDISWCFIGKLIAGKLILFDTFHATGWSWQCWRDFSRLLLELTFCFS